MQNNTEADRHYSILTKADFLALAETNPNITLHINYGGGSTDSISPLLSYAQAAAEVERTSIDGLVKMFIDAYGEPEGKAKAADLLNQRDSIDAGVDIVTMLEERIATLNDPLLVAYNMAATTLGADGRGQSWIEVDNSRYYVLAEAGSRPDFTADTQSMTGPGL